MEQLPNSNQTNSELLVAQIGKPTVSDPFVIEHAEISGNTLVMRVSYSGGCENLTLSSLQLAKVVSDLEQKSDRWLELAEFV